MTAGLKRYQHEGDLHLITFSCYRRLPYLGIAAARDRFELSLEASRSKHGFQVIAYVVCRNTCICYWRNRPRRIYPA